MTTPDASQRTESYMHDQTFKTLHEFVKAAHLRLNQTHWDYLIGGTETETTVSRNRHAIDSKALLPRVLRDVTAVDPGCKLLGQSLAMPVVLAPIGSLQVIDSQGGACLLYTSPSPRD